MSARAQPPVLPPPVAPHMPAIRRLTPAGGLPCYLVEQHALPIAEVRLIARGGAGLDQPQHAGRARMLAELLDQGTASRTAMHIAAEAELLGATLETRATWDSSAVALHVLAPRLPQAFELLCDVALRPAFAPSELERKRAERLAAILQEHKDPRVLASQAFHRRAYPADHPYSVPAAGTTDTVAALSRDDVLGLYAETFTPDNCFLVVVGDVAPDAFMQLAATAMAGWDRSGRTATPPAEVLPERGRAVHIVARPGAPQSELRVGLPGPPRRTADYFPLLLANTVLGGAFTSRLNMRLREEKAYTYGAGSGFAFRAGGGPFIASTAVATAATADALAVIVHEIERMAVEPVPAQELERARRYLVLGLGRTFETTADLAEHAAEIALHDLPLDWYDGYADAIRAVSAEDVQRAAARWLRSEHLTIALAGDAAAVRDEIESLNIGAVHVHESN